MGIILLSDAGLQVGMQTAISPKSLGKLTRGWRTDPRAVNGRAGAWRQVRGPYPLRVPVHAAERCGSEEELRASLQTLHSLPPSY